MNNGHNQNGGLFNLAYKDPLIRISAASVKNGYHHWFSFLLVATHDHPLFFVFP